VKLAKGGSDTQTKLLKAIKKESTKSTPNGAAFRWAVAASETGQIQLQLQLIPLPANTVNAAPVLQADNVAVKVDTPPLNTVMRFFRIPTITV
jgi:hypothetical protein